VIGSSRAASGHLDLTALRVGGSDRVSEGTETAWHVRLSPARRVV